MQGKVHCIVSRKELLLSDDGGRQDVVTLGQKRKRQDKNELFYAPMWREDLTVDSLYDHDSTTQQPSKQFREDSDRHHNAPCEMLSPMKNMLP